MVKQYIDTFTVWAHTAEEAVELVLAGKANHKGAEESVMMGQITAEVPLGQNPNHINFTKSMMAMAQQRAEAAKQAQEGIVVPDIKVDLSKLHV